MATKAPIRVIVINPATKEITEQTVTPTFEKFYKIMNCTQIEACRPSLPNGHFLWVDEEGWFKSVKNAFVIRGYQSSLVGTAIIVSGNDEAACKLSIDKVKEMVRFL